MKLILVLIIFINLIVEVNANNLKQTINSNYAILYNIQHDTILYDKNIHKSYNPASLTKIISLNLVTKCIDLNQNITIDKQVIDSVFKNSSHISLNYNEIIKGYDLAYATMVVSGNDAINALAIKCAGSIDHFVSLMNQYRDNLSLVNTNFINPNGLNDIGHYTSAYDMAMFIKDSINNPLFVKYFDTKIYNIPKTNKYPSRQLINTNALIRELDYILGGKTGWDGKNNYTLATHSLINNNNYIIVTLDAKDRQSSYQDHLNLINHASKYNTIIYNKDNIEPIIIDYHFMNLLNQQVIFTLKDNIELLSQYDINDINYEITINNKDDYNNINAFIELKVLDKLIYKEELNKELIVYDISFYTIILPILTIISLIIIIISILIYKKNKTKYY